MTEETVKNGIESLKRKGYIDSKVTRFYTNTLFCTKRVINVNWDFIESIEKIRLDYDNKNKVNQVEIDINLN